MQIRLLRPRNGMPPVQQAVQAFQAFVRAEISGGILLLASAIIALAWANSPWQDTYFRLWETHLTLDAGGWRISESLRFLVDEGLMTVFFFVVGLEIKRELLIGELAEARKAVLPVAAAIGGMVAPALIYLAITAGTSGSSGWGIPMATDIAFALGLLVLLGSRVPVGLKVFLTALAIVDDVGAVIVIAAFYTSGIAWLALGAAAGVIVLLVLANRADIHHALVYITLGVALWSALLVAGIHGTIAGVIVAMLVPARARIDSEQFIEGSLLYLRGFRRAGFSTRTDFVNEEHQMAMDGLQRLCKHVEAPAHRMQHVLHPWVAFVIMPLFALANAGVTFAGNPGVIVSSPVTLGVILGLLIGKPLGILLMTWISLKLKWAELPLGVTLKQVFGVGFIAGIGFTMSLFMTALAFPGGPAEAQAKEGILIAALAAGMIGWIVLRSQKKAPAHAPARETAREDWLPERETVG